MADIKWRDKDIKQLRKEINRYNKKVRYEAKKNLDVKLPEIKKFDEVKAKITNRNEYNRTINSLRRIYNKKSFNVVRNNNGVRITRYEYNETKLNLRYVNNKNSKLRAALDISPERGNLGVAKDFNFINRELNFDKRSTESWVRLNRILDKQQYESYYFNMRSQYVANMLSALDTYLLPVISNYSKYEEVYSFFENLSEPLLIDEFITDYPWLTLTYIYDKNVEGEDKLDRIANATREFTNKIVNRDIYKI